MEIPKEFIADINFLRILEDPIEKEKICVCQVNKEGKLTFSDGNSLGFYGTQILYNINDAYEDNELYTPIISL